MTRAAYGRTASVRSPSIGGIRRTGC